MSTKILRWQLSLLITSSTSIEYPSTRERVGLEVDNDIDGVSIDIPSSTLEFQAPNVTVLSHEANG